MIRKAKIADVPAMALLWHERLTILQQTDRRFQIAPDGLNQWSDAIMRRLGDSDYVVYVAEDREQLVGYIIGYVQPGPPGLIPPHVGAILELAVGAHSNQAGLGRQLLEPVCKAFRARGLERMIAYVSSRQPVEQAFWRSMQTSELMDVMWMKL